jgi:hypothetical protein
MNVNRILVEQRLLMPREYILQLSQLGVTTNKTSPRTTHNFTEP